MEAAETFDHAGLTVEIHYDSDPEVSNPREWDQLGTMVCWHPDYILGDEQMKDGSGRGAIKNAVDFDTSKIRSMDHLYRYLGIVRKAVCILPLSIYDHSGITMYVGGKHDFPFDSAGWDTTFVGFIYTTHERVTELCGDGAEYHTDEFIEKQLRSEIKEYDSYLRGEVYGYIIKGPDGEDLETDEIDSCWGFVGDIKYVTEEAKSVAESLAKSIAEKREEEALERTRAANMDVATS